jgi:hypothetical protein
MLSGDATTVVKDRVHVRDFQATLLHLIDIDHERFTYDPHGLRPG